MASESPMVPKGVNLKRTERFLLTLPEVVNADVWYDEVGLMARVTVSGDSPTTARGIQSECLHNLGVHQTPRQVVLEWAMPIAA